MEYQSIVIPFTDDTTVAGAFLVLEQEDYPESDQLTMLGVARLLTNVISSLTTTVSECIMSSDGKRFETTVLAYPYPSTLIYNVGVVNGIAYRTGGGLETKTETLKFSLANTATLKYPVHTFLSGEWLSDTYSVDGSVLPIITVTHSDQNIYTEEKVYGTYEVKYTTWVEEYIVSISARSEAVENFFQSVFYASFDYGIELLNLEPPPNAEENYLNGVDCNGGTDGITDGDTTIIDGEGSPDIPIAEPFNEIITLNYCEDFGNG